MSRSRGRRYLLAARLNEKPSEGRFGSTFPLTALTDPRLLLGVKQSKSAIKRTSSVTVGSLPICQENWVEVPDRPRCHVMKDLQIRIERL
jgi:hypothetical protein